MLTFGEKEPTPFQLGYNVPVTMDGSAFNLFIGGGVGQAILTVQALSDCCGSLAVDNCFACGETVNSPVLYSLWDYDTRDVTPIKNERDFNSDSFTEYLNTTVGEYGSIVSLSQICVELAEYLNNAEFPNGFFQTPVPLV